MNKETLSDIFLWVGLAYFALMALDDLSPSTFGNTVANIPDLAASVTGTTGTSAAIANLGGAAAVWAIYAFVLP